MLAPASPGPHPGRDPRALPDEDGQPRVGGLDGAVVLRHELPGAGGGRGLLAEVQPELAEGGGGRKAGGGHGEGRGGRQASGQV